MAKVLWYYQQSGEEHGPVSSADLRRMAARGKLDPTDLVRRESMEEWVEAHRLRGVEFSQTAPSSKKPATKTTKAKKEKPAKANRADIPASLESGQPAGIIRRWFAFVIDSTIDTILSLGGFTVGLMISGVSLLDMIASKVDVDKLNSGSEEVIQAELEKMGTVLMENLDALLIPSVLLILLPFLYHLVFEWSRAGGTIGKMMCGIKIVKTDGDHAGFFRILWRILMKFLITFGVLSGLGALTALFTSLKQSTHDLLSGTMVIRK
ncbi:MAG: RDD family protein [Planctomycetaceae bacterium]|nr:RDD family protein [Planctomycetaceae bacterium]